MITRITGILESIDANTAVIAPVGGHAAYELMLPANTAHRLLMHVGQSVTLHTIEYLEQQAQGATLIPRLVGFATPEERRFFQLFTTVKGVGAKKALRAMAAPISEMAGAISRRDTAALKALPEIGPRLAETIVAELRGKVEPFLVAGGSSAADRMVEATTTAASAAAERAIAALMRLGETRDDAETLIRRAVKVTGEAASADELVAAAFSART
jgi:Holliday junction DNA helicase RuvA